MRPKASRTFLENDDQLLWLGLMVRDTGRPASEHLKIKDEVAALSLNLAVTLRLFRFDNERRENDRKMLAYEVCRMAFGEKDESESDVTVV